MRYPDELVNSVADAYDKGESAPNLAERHGMSTGTVLAFARRKGKKIRDRRECQARYTIDETFFDVIDTPEKAQILGFIWADGCLHVRSPESRRLQIILKADDADYLEWIKRTMRSEAPVTIRTYACSDGRTRRVTRFVTANARLIDGIVDKGLLPRKSLTIEFPSESAVPRHLWGAFVRGVFEGDGCIYVPPPKSRKNRCADVSIAGSIAFCAQLQILLAAEGIKTSIQHHGKIDAVRIGTISGVMRFYDFVYTDATYRMERKHVRFVQFKARYDENLNHRFNLRSTAVAATVKAPNGTLYHFNTVKDFASEMGLHVGSFYPFARGENRGYKGWTHPTESEISAARAANTLIVKSYRTSEPIAQPTIAPNP